MAGHFTDPDVWHGGAWDLVILAGSRFEVSPELAEARLDMLLRAVWAAPMLDGPYARQDLAPEEQQRVDPSFRAQAEHGLFGLARLPAGLAACTTYVLRDDPGERDWVYVDLPIGELDRLGLDVEWPRTDDAALAQVRAVLLDIAHAVYESVPFEAAGIGHELLGPDVADYLRDRESFRSADWLLGSPRGLSVVSAK